MAYIINNDNSSGYSRADFLTALGQKQNTLVSGVNIKTVNGSSVLGVGDLAVVKAWSVKTAKSFIAQNPTLMVQGSYKWAYQAGLMLLAMIRVHDVYDVADENGLVAYAKKYYHDRTNSSGINGGGSPYSKSNYSLDHVMAGFNLFRLKELDGNPYTGYYDTVIGILADQLADQPRLSAGKAHPYYHKAIYPHQAWLDGLFMCEPFRALRASKELSGAAQTAEYDDIANQLIEVGTLTYDSDTGLYRHAFAEAGSDGSNGVIGWADADGKAYFTWGRGLGWYIMAIEEVLDILPTSHSKRQALITILQGICSALKNYRDPETGVWRRLPTYINQTTKAPLDERNGIEASASCMYAYGYLHGVRKDYLDSADRSYAKAAFEAAVSNFVTVNNGNVVISNCEPSGNPGGTAVGEQVVLENYLTNNLVNNDPHSIGPFILAALEYEQMFGNIGNS